jgi:tetratricopeptide (TPR) repeat protein
MIFAGLTFILSLIAILGAIGAFLGIREFSQIRQIQTALSDKLRDFDQELNKINSYRSSVNENFGRFIEEIYNLNEGKKAYYFGDYLKARTFLYNTIEINPDNTRAYYYIAHAHKREGDLVKAEEIFRKILEIEPNNVWAYYGLARIYKRIDENKAVEYYNKCRELDPNNRRVLSSLGVFYGNKGDLKKAMELLHAAYNSEQNAMTAFNLGLIYHAQKKAEESSRYFDECVYWVHQNVEKARSLHWSFFRLGVIAGLNGDFDKCTTQINKALSYNSSDSVKSSLKDRLAFLRNYTEDKQMIDRMIELLK